MGLWVYQRANREPDGYTPGVLTPTEMRQEFVDKKKEATAVASHLEKLLILKHKTNLNEKHILI